MAERRRLSVRTSIQTAWAVMLASVVLAAVVLHSCSVAQEAKSRQDAAALVLARSLGDQVWLSGSISPEALHQSCNQLIKQPVVWAVSVWDRANRLMATASIDPCFEPLLRGEAETGRPQSRGDLVQVSPNLGGDLKTARRVQVDVGLPGETQRPARVVLLLDPAAPLGSTSTGQRLYYTSVLGVGVTVWLFGVWWVRREFLRPMLSLAGRSTPSEADPSRYAITGRDDELGAIARSLEGLQEEIEEWRGRAELIERRMDSKIAAETQRISRELRRVQREAWLDPLTRVNNRRLFDEKFASIFAAQRSPRHDLSVVMIDLDSFKRVNDALGHVRGDALLRFAGELLRQCIRHDDFAVRYGGDEFLLILPGTSAEDAAVLVKRIVALFAQRAKMIANVQPPPSMSAGIASIKRNLPATPADLIEAADQALYQAKRQPGKGLRLADPPMHRARSA